MQQNVGRKEKYFRLGIGVLSSLAALKFSKSKAMSAGLGVIGVAGLGTGLSRYCPANTLLGIDNSH